jgi:hypothetical protein
MEAVRSFCDSVVAQDYERAYALGASELKTWMSYKRFLTTLDQADKQFGGKPVDFQFDELTWIYADEAARERSNRDGLWPKDTPKQNKRALVGVFWVKDKTTRQGCWGFFWVTEENGQYRIAKFSHYLQ